MANVVALLEKIGQDSQLRLLTGEQLARELALAGLEPAVQTALVHQQPRRLEELIGANKNVCCLIHAPQDEEPDGEEPENDEQLQGYAQPRVAVSI